MFSVMVELILLYVTSVLIIFGYSTGCDLSSNKTYINAHHQVVLFDSMIITNNSLEIEFDIKLDKYCRSCTIMQIDDIISLSIDSRYNIFEISINNEETDNTHIPNADILLPTGNQFHHIYLSNSFLSNTSIYNQNIFIIDNLERYYPKSILANTDPYQVYIGDFESKVTDSLNASIKNICINSSIKTTNNIFTGELRCGDMLYGELSWSGHVDYYYFELPHTSNVIFDSCDSSYGTYLDFHTLSYEKISAVWENNCYPGAQLLLPSLPKGRYLLEMGVDGDDKARGNDYRSWQLTVSCSINRKDHNNNDQNNSYYVLPEVTLQNTEWFEAERKCEELYGTTLATIITDDDVVKAYDVINDNLDITVNVSIWIGLSQIAIDGLSWKWVDDTSCDYTTSGDCIDDMHWHSSQPDRKRDFSSSYVQRFAAVLFITEHTDHTNLPTFYALPFDANPPGDLFFLCNGADSKYNIKKCFDDNCWQYDSWADQFSDYKIQSDVTGIFNPFIGHWNSTLFIIGHTEIHYTHFQPFDEQYFWYHQQYNVNNGSYWNNAQLYTQYKSAVYVYGTQFNSKSLYNQAVLLRIDLDTLESTQENVNFYEDIPLVTKCIVAGENSVYFMQQTRILIYHTDIKELWTGSTLPAFTAQTTTTDCVITDNEEFIYVFAMTYRLNSYHIMFTTIKYEIGIGKIISVQNSDNCLIRNGFVTAVAAENGNIYLHGCNAAGWKTMIYDTVNDEYKNTTVNIANPWKTDIPYYRSSKLVSLDNNILYLYAKNDRGFSSYVTVTNLVSIDFSQTKNTEKIWPSDGFDITYYMNDFNSNLTQDYHVLFYSNDAQTDINQLITFNTLKDHCICYKSLYKCYGCRQHFDLKSHLTLQDNYVDKLTFTTIYQDPGQFSKPLITPNIIVIPLQRCTISISRPKEIIISKVVHSVVSRFNLSSNCHTRHHMNFSLNITAEYVSKELIISIISDNETVCKICDYQPIMKQQDHCHECSGNHFTIIQNLDGIEDTNFTFNFTSNMIDLKVLSPANDTIAHWIDPKIISKKSYQYYYFFSAIIIPILLFSWLCHCRKQYMNAFIVDKALVLIIAIDKFNDEKMFLPGVKPARNELENLWRHIYNYDVFVCNKYQEKCNKQDVIDFIDNNLKRLNYEPYKAIIVHVISHGSMSKSEGSTFKCSDLKNLDIGFLKHELTEAAKEGETSDFIKLIFNHVCQGENDYSDGNGLSPEIVTIVRHGNTDEQYEYQKGRIPDKSPGFNNRHSTDDISPDSNLEVIAGNGPGRTMSDSGNFTGCICQSFEKNEQRKIKSDYNILMTEIARNLEKKSKSAELMHRSGNLRYTQIRFEKHKNKNRKHPKNTNKSYTEMMNNKSDSLSQYLLDNE
eukprot:505797_1